MFSLPKLTVHTYPEMLRKISGCTFVISLICIHALRYLLPDIQTALAAIDIAIPKSFFPEVTIPLGTFIPAVLVAIISEVFKLHDKLSDVFAIRREFDVRYILLPMAVLCGVKLTEPQIQSLIARRVEIMGRVFYAYASSTPNAAQIDEHDITMAMTQWSNYWCAAEASWPAAGSKDTELGVLMEPEADHGTTEVYARVQT